MSEFIMGLMVGFTLGSLAWFLFIILLGCSQ